MSSSSAPSVSVSPPVSEPVVETVSTGSRSNERVFASPLAKVLASEAGINDLSKITGSGPDGRIIKQDI